MPNPRRSSFEGLQAYRSRGVVARGMILSSLSPTMSSGPSGVLESLHCASFGNKVVRKLCVCPRPSTRSDNIYFSPLLIFVTQCDLHSTVRSLSSAVIGCSPRASDALALSTSSSKQMLLTFLMSRWWWNDRCRANPDKLGFWEGTTIMRCSNCSWLTPRRTCLGQMHPSTQSLGMPGLQHLTLKFRQSGEFSMRGKNA